MKAWAFQKKKLAGFIDFFVSSTYVHIRKPDMDIYKLALDLEQVQPGEVIYIDDTAVFITVAEGLGIKHKYYIRKNGLDMPEIRDWKWKN